MLNKFGTEDIAGVASLFLGIGIVASQVPVVTTGLTLVVAGLGLVAGGLAEGIMKMFEVA